MIRGAREALTASLIGLLMLAPTPASALVKALVTFSILGDMVHVIGGERTRVETLVGPESDAHVYRPTPQDAQRIAYADIVVINGAGFEGWITRLIAASGYAGPMVTVTDNLLLRRTPAGFNHDHGSESDAAGAFDAHAWQDPLLALGYVEAIRRGLSEVDPQGAAVFARNAARYAADIRNLRQELQTMVAKVPPDQRRVMTSHRAFDYLGAAFQIEFLSPTLQSDHARPSAADIARLLREARQHKVNAMFLERSTDPRLVKLLARETGARLGGTLYADALSVAGGPAATYLEMMRHNVRTLVAGLQPP